jgi:hypothetical protein
MSRRDLPGRGRGRVEQRGDQAVRLGAGLADLRYHCDGVLHDPDRHPQRLAGSQAAAGEPLAACPVPLGFRGLVRIREHAEIGAVGQLAQYRQPPAVLDAHDQVSPGGGDTGDLRMAGKVPVGQHQHAGVEDSVVDELVQQQWLAGTHCRPDRVDQRPGAAGDQGQQPDLRIPARADPPARRTAERFAVRRGVRDIQPGAIRRYLQQGQLPAEGRHPRQARGRPGTAQPPEQRLYRRPAQAAPGLHRGRDRGDLPPAPRDLGSELLEQRPQHLAVSRSRTEPQGQHEVQRHPSGQSTAARFPAAALLDHFVHQLGRQNLRNGTEAEPVQRMLSRLSAGVRSP